MDASLSYPVSHGQLVGGNKNERFLELYLNDNLCVLSINEKNFTLVYTEYFINSVDFLKIACRKELPYLYRVDHHCVLTYPHYIIFFSDLEWWSSRNTTVVISVIYFNNGEAFLRENVKTLSYPETIFSRNIECVYSPCEDSVVFVFNTSKLIVIDEICIVEKSKLIDIAIHRIGEPWVIKNIKPAVKKLLTFDKYLLGCGNDLLCFMRDSQTVISLAVDLEPFEHWCCVENMGKLCIIFSQLQVPFIQLKQVDFPRNLTERAAVNTFETFLNLSETHQIYDIGTSTFHGFRLYVLVHQLIHIIDMKKKILIKQLVLPSAESFSNIFVSLSGLQVAAVGRKNSVSVFQLDYRILDFSLKYFAADVVVKIFSQEEIEGFRIPLKLKWFITTYLLNRKEFRE